MEKFWDNRQRRIVYVLVLISLVFYYVSLEGDSNRYNTEITEDTIPAGDNHIEMTSSFSNYLKINYIDLRFTMLDFTEIVVDNEFSTRQDLWRITIGVDMAQIIENNNGEQVDSQSIGHRTDRFNFGDRDTNWIILTEPEDERGITNLQLTRTIKIEIDIDRPDLLLSNHDFSVSLHIGLEDDITYKFIIYPLVIIILATPFLYNRYIDRVLRHQLASKQYNPDHDIREVLAGFSDNLDFKKQEIKKELKKIQDDAEHDMRIEKQRSV